MYLRIVFCIIIVCAFLTFILVPKKTAIK